MSILLCNNTPFLNSFPPLTSICQPTAKKATYVWNNSLYPLCLLQTAIMEALDTPPVTCILRETGVTGARAWWLGSQSAPRTLVSQISQVSLLLLYCFSLSLSFSLLKFFICWASTLPHRKKNILVLSLIYICMSLH